MAERRESAVRRDGSFDAFDVALRRASLRGTLDAASLPRAADHLAAEGGAADIAWRITGIADTLGRPALEVSLDGAVPLECQRCLRPFAWRVEQQTLLLLARDERELARLDEDDEHEVVLAAMPLDPRTLAEDELLLTLPFAPHCERGDCTGPAVGAAGTAVEAPAKTSAFSTLAGLKTGAAHKVKR